MVSTTRPEARLHGARLPRSPENPQGPSTRNGAPHPQFRSLPRVQHPGRYTPGVQGLPAEGDRGGARPTGTQTCNAAGSPQHGPGSEWRAEAGSGVDGGGRGHGGEVRGTGWRAEGATGDSALAPFLPRVGTPG